MHTNKKTKNKSQQEFLFRTKNTLKRNIKCTRITTQKANFRHYKRKFCVLNTYKFTNFCDIEELFSKWKCSTKIAVSLRAVQSRFRINFNFSLMLTDLIFYFLLLQIMALDLCTVERNQLNIESGGSSPKNT